MKIGAVVVTYNSRDTIERCVESLRQQHLIDQVIMIDNASSDRTSELIPQEWLVQNEDNVGFARAVNQGVKLLAEDTDHILLLNPDAWLTDGALALLLAALRSEERAGATGPQQLTEEDYSYPSAWRFPNTLIWLLMQLHLARLFPRKLRTRIFLGHYLPRSGEPIKVGWLMGSCVLIKRSMWDDMGGFDESFFMFGEEVDLFWRAHERGWFCVFVPEAIIYHLVGHSTKVTSSAEEYDARRWVTTKTLCRKHMSYVHFFTWTLLQRWIERQNRRAHARQRSG